MLCVFDPPCLGQWTVPTSPPDRPDLQAAVDRANAAIRRFLRQVPGGRLTVADRARYDALVDAYMGAVAVRDGARGREGGDEEARAA